MGKIIQQSKSPKQIPVGADLRVCPLVKNSETINISETINCVNKNHCAGTKGKHAGLPLQTTNTQQKRWWN